MGVRICTLKAIDLNFFLLDHTPVRPLSFQMMKRIEILKMKVKHLKADWLLLLNRINMIPSQVLKKLSIETETFNPTQLKELVDALEIKKWKI